MLEVLGPERGVGNGHHRGPPDEGCEPRRPNRPRSLDAQEPAGYADRAEDREELVAHEVDLAAARDDEPSHRAEADQREIRAEVIPRIPAAIGQQALGNADDGE